MDRNHDNRCRFNDKDIRHMRCLRAGGATLSDISTLFHCTKTTVRRLCDESVAAQVRDYAKEAARKACRKVPKEINTARIRKYRQHVKEIMQCENRKK